MSLSAPRARVLSAYRQLFRARSKLFRGDNVALRESRTAIREQFVQNAGAETSGPHFEGLLQMADEAADMLLRGIVQGRLNETTGHYGTCVTRLRRHEL
jgi:Complex 1 protein (LYR family)